MSYRSLSVLVRDTLGLAGAELTGLHGGGGAPCIGGERGGDDASGVIDQAFWRGIPRSPTSAFEALTCLDLAGERLRAAGDPRAAFTDVYAAITRRVCQALRGEAPPRFEEPRFISRLAGRFCSLYLAALGRSLAGAPEPIAAWGVAHRLGRSRRSPPVQHALLGLNAHINYDLAVGLSVNISTLGARGAAAMARYRHDHDAVNDILEAAMPESLELLSVRHGCPVSTGLLAAPRKVREAAFRAALLALRVWRARVWDDQEALRAAAPAEQRRILLRMNMRAGLFAHLLAVRVPDPRWLAPVPQACVH